MTLSNAFSPVNNSAAHYRKTSKIQGSKTPPPFSLRLNAEERARLTKEARGVPLGTYIKAKLLADGTPIRLRGSGVSVEDKAALAKALALLGQSRMANNLNQLAHLAHIGALPLTPETEQDLADAIASIQEIRSLLLRALGKTGGTP